LHWNGNGKKTKKKLEREGWKYLHAFPLLLLLAYFHRISYICSGIYESKSARGFKLFDKQKQSKSQQRIRVYTQLNY